MRDIIVGRLESDRQKFGMAGTVLIGKQYIKMGRTMSLSNKVYLDVARAHVVFICGKRGGGKSYTMGAIAEGMATLPPEINQNLCFILLDTMGIYWTMKYANKKDEEILDEWGFKGQGLDVKIYTPYVFYKQYKEKGIPTDFPFSLNPADFDSSDWQMTFDLSSTEPVGVLIERIINSMKKKYDTYGVAEIIKEIESDTHTDQNTKDAAINRFMSTEAWGVFSKEGTKLKDLVKPGQVTVLDVSCYATAPGGWKIKALIVGLVAQRLFIERMLSRKNEEYQEIHETTHYFSEGKEKKMEFPMVWLVIDEAHEFLPREGKNPATDPLVTIMREGRQPGISLILATQQPGKIHTDVMTQSDTVISHRITARLDVEALGMLTQSYMREGLTLAIDNLPRVKGSAVVFDDSNEKLYMIRVRPRFTWHGGEAPMAVKQEKKQI